MRKNIFKTTAMTVAVLTMAIGMTACGNKTSDTTGTQSVQETKAVVSKDIKTNTEMTNSEAVTTKAAQDNTTEAITEEQTEVVVADNNVSEDTVNENVGDNGVDNGNVSDTPSNEPVEAPDVPSEPEPTPTPEPQPEEPAPVEPEVITKVNPYDGKTYRYVAPEDMDYKYGLGRGSEVSAINGNPDVDWDYSCEFKTLTTRTFYQLDGTYTVYEGWYSRSGDFTATPKQIASSLGIDPYKAFGSCAIVGKFYDEKKDCYRNVAFCYLRP